MTQLFTQPKSRSRPAPTKKLLFQPKPVFGSQRHGFKKTTICGRIAWAACLAGQLLANERLIGNGFRYPYCGTIKFLDELDAKDIRKAWAAICRKLKSVGVVAHWNMEVARTNLVDFHLVIRECPAELLTSRRRKIKAAIRSVCKYRLNIQVDPIKTTSRKWVHYVLKAKVKGIRNSKTTIDDAEDFEAMIAAQPSRFTADY
jgi:hypothetical protein